MSDLEAARASWDALPREQRGDDSPSTKAAYIVGWLDGGHAALERQLAKVEAVRLERACLDEVTS